MCIVGNLRTSKTTRRTWTGVYSI